MGLTTIEWTDRTWNPWYGCHKVSPGCKFCYMFRDKARYGQNPNVVTRSKTLFRAPLKWPQKPQRCFTCSWSDWLIEEADPWREEAYDIIRRTPWITYQILTKRIERAAGRVPDPALPNIWWGVSVENQHYADERIPLLLQTPAAVRFVSYEPAMGPVDFARWLPVCGCAVGIKGSTQFGNTFHGLLCDKRKAGLDWIIAGGESGPLARPANGRWFISVLDQCRASGTPFFFKQWGEYIPCPQFAKDAIETDWGYVQRVGKKAAGRLLEGREWNEMPKTANGVHE